MDPCRHLHLVLLPQAAKKLRCRRCHLTISPEELKGSHCPECYEAHGRKSFDFEEVEPSGEQTTRYRCEKCGAIIEVD